VSDVKFRKRGERGQYEFLNAQCIEADCWTPGEYQTRGATGPSGSRATGRSTKCCARRAYHGCPSPIVYLPDLRKKRALEGWTKV
jgi:hypothetical protein